ncbi:hypothetical protein Tco_0610497, partial [Tanacetum coccineum]
MKWVQVVRGDGAAVGGCGGFGWLPLAVVGTRWVMRGRWWVGGVEAAGMVMMAVGDGVRCGGVDGGCGVAAAVGWLGWCEGGVEVAAVEWGRRGGAWRRV